MGNEVSLASPYSSFNDLDQPDGKKGLAPWTNTKVENVCQYMEDLTKVNKVLSTYNPKNYNYQYTGSYVCPDAEKMIWAQCDGAVCEVVDEQGKPKPFHEWTPSDPSICTCQAVQSPALMPGPISEDGKPDPEFAQKYCGQKPDLDSIDYPETGVHIALSASPKLLETPVYDYLFEFYAGHTFKATPKETQELTPFP